MPMPNFNTQIPQIEPIIPVGRVNNSFNTNTGVQNITPEEQGRRWEMYNHMPDVIREQLGEEYAVKMSAPNANEEQINDYINQEWNNRTLNALNQAANDFYQNRITPADMHDLIYQYGSSFDTKRQYWTDEHQKSYKKLYDLGMQLERQYNLTNPIADDYYNQFNFNEYNNF